MGPKTNPKASKGGKQNGNKSNGGKLQPQNSRTQKEQNGDANIDYSMLRKPIDINVNGVGQVLKVYQTATAEVRHLLQYESNLVYECKVCTNLFRSLANFISHKRVYCREMFSDTKRVFPTGQLIEDSTMVIQPEPVGPSVETWNTSDATPNPSEKNLDGPPSPHIQTSVPRIATFTNPKKDLSQIVERLAQRRGVKTVTETAGHISASKFYETVTDQLNAKKEVRKEHIVQLEAMENTKYGVFQTVLQSSSTVHMENTDLMKAQVVEIQNMMSCNEAVLGPDGQVAVMNGEGTTELNNTEGKDEALVKKKDNSPSSKSVSPKENHVCSICKTRFSTRKTLSHHMKSLHVTFRMCYPCPCCKNTFCNTWSVYRHLYKVHRKTTLQVRKLRSQIVNKAFRKEVSDESQNNSPKTNVPAQTEADKARKEQQRLHQENQAWMNNLEGDLELQMCGGCGRRFERKAALNSHSQICQKRIAVQNNIKVRRLSPTNSVPTLSNKVPGTKILSPADISKNDSIYGDSNSNRLTPISLHSECGNKGIITPSPSPVPIDLFLSASPSASLHRTRHTSGSSSTKKEVPEKRIEIQIRRDYCKAGTSTAGSHSHQDFNSEANENVCDVGNEEDTKSYNGEGKVYQARELQTATIKKTDDIPKLNVCRYPGRRFNNCDIDDDDDDEFYEVSSNHSMPDSENRSTNQSDRSVSSSRRDSGLSDNIRMSSNGEEQEDLSPTVDNDEPVTTPEEKTPPKIPPFTIKKEEQLSPVMENRMQSMINIRRLQCLPCQKKFNKLTNLRRHVAVHIGWNRYRCTECPFKCFSKYDCVAHANKMHLVIPDRDKAEAMVQYIETQASDSESESCCEVNNGGSVKSETNEDETKEQLKYGSLEKGVEEWSVCDDKNSVPQRPIVAIRLRSGRGSDVQGDQRVKPGRGRPRKRHATSDGAGLAQGEAVPTKKLLPTAQHEESIKDESAIESEELPKSSDVEPESTDNETPEESPSKPQDSQQTALRKMVLQVIFGPGSNSVSQDIEIPDNLFAISMNGEAQHTGSTSSPEPYEVVEAASSDAASPLSTPSSRRTPEEVVEISEQALQVKGDSKSMKQSKATNSVEVERRQRPVRNRIRVEREDFIYDLSDRCLEPKKDGEERNKLAKRKQESVKVFVEKGNGSRETNPKVVPKLMLVRTSVDEFSNIKVKSSNSGDVPQALDDKNAVAYNISTRKSQRTYDISPHTFKQQ